MNFTKKILLTFSILLALAVSASAQKPFFVNLWQNGAPNDNGDVADTATVKVFLPRKEEATGNMGIAAIVLKYRMPHGNCDVPVADAEEAMKLVRRNANAWNIKADQVGIMGFSAGGHLASTIATHSKGDAKPDFQILFYPVITMLPDITHKGSHNNFLGKDAKKKDEKLYSNDAQVSRATPRAFIALCDDDHVVLPANGVNYYTELYRHDVPASLHVYPSGGHGFGIRDSFKFHNEMELELKAWLRSF